MPPDCSGRRTTAVTGKPPSANWRSTQSALAPCWRAATTSAAGKGVVSVRVTLVLYGMFGTFTWVLSWTFRVSMAAQPLPIGTPTVSVAEPTVTGLLLGGAL